MVIWHHFKCLKYLPVSMEIKNNDVVFLPRTIITTLKPVIAACHLRLQGWKWIEI